MQDAIVAAREAEATAKRVPEKGAFCLRVLKRSGDAVEFVARFDTGVIGVWAELEQGDDRLSNRFAYRYVQLLRPLLIDSSRQSNDGWIKSWDRSLLESVQAELQHSYFQQNESTRPVPEKRHRARRQADRWIRSLVGEVDRCNDPDFRPSLAPRDFIHFWMAWAFMRRLAETTTPNS
jgi:hypothetical protein